MAVGLMRSLHVCGPQTNAAPSQTTFFTGEDIDAMFSLFDPTGRGHISHEQYDNGESSLEPLPGVLSR